MPAPLYSRYVPPKAQPVHRNPPFERISPTGAKKRRNEADDSSTRHQKKAKKRELSNGSVGADGRRSVDPALASLTGLAGNGVHANGRSARKTAPAPSSLGQPDGVGVEEERDINEDTLIRQIGEAAVGLSLDGTSHGSQGYEGKRQKMNERREEVANGSTENFEDGDAATDPPKHASLLSKYKKAVKDKPLKGKDEVDKKVTDTMELRETSIRGLEPMPLPKPASYGPGLTTRSALPSWLSKPSTVGKDASSSFRDLEIRPDILKNLQSKGFEHALPVQTAVLPLLLPLHTQHPGDVCVSAATGSGKTLGYTLPLVQDLSCKTATQLRAVIVVPTRELVKQVEEVLELCKRGTELKVATASGAQRFEDEQTAILDELPYLNHDFAPTNPIRIGEAHHQEHDSSDNDDDEEASDSDELNIIYPSPATGTTKRIDHRWKVDVLIATPGRLVDHIKRTRGFDLHTLRWLIIDEADRLLDSSFQEWVETVVTALQVPSSYSTHPYLASVLAKPPIPKLRKVMLSATMTNDLQKLSSLQLRNPKLVVIEGTYSINGNEDEEPTSEGLALPSNLSEHGVPVGDGSDKPLYLVRLLDNILAGVEPGHVSQRPQSNGPELKNEARRDNELSDDSDVSSVLSDSSDASENLDDASENLPAAAEKQERNALIFTSSTESANRLSRLLNHLRSSYRSITATITKSGTSNSKAKAISRFRAGKLNILIATDRVARGLDLPNLANVINYDIPNSITSYVHRIGRTARAGRGGSAWTLLEDRQARWFWKQVAAGSEIQRHAKVVKRMRVDLELLDAGVREQYATALRGLQDDVKQASK